MDKKLFTKNIYIFRCKSNVRAGQKSCWKLNYYTWTWEGANLPNNHGILVCSFLALLGKEWSNLTWTIQKQSPWNPMQRLLPPVVKWRIPWPQFFSRALPLPDSQARRGWRTWDGAPAFRREAGPHSKGPDNV